MKKKIIISVFIYLVIITFLLLSDYITFRRGLGDLFELLKFLILFILLFFFFLFEKEEGRLFYIITLLTVLYPIFSLLMRGPES